MGDRRSPSRPKRMAKAEEGSWDCSVCTYRNTAEAFKCSMCDVRKGTSTRKPKLNSQIAAQQFSPPPQPKKEKKEKLEPVNPSSSKRIKKQRPALKNVDRSSPQHLAVTVGSVTVIITDFTEQMSGMSESTSFPEAVAHGSPTRRDHLCSASETGSSVPRSPEGSPKSAMSSEP
uniref:YY1-associated factor 2-like isoform X1 n=1 Tax=Myxine glutinosa TaxID=7769 RepID=UPI00358FE116